MLPRHFWYFLHHLPVSELGPAAPPWCQSRELCCVLTCGPNYSNFLDSKNEGGTANLVGNDLSYTHVTFQPDLRPEKCFRATFPPGSW